MSAQQARDARADRRPPWLQAKHSAGPVNPKLADWADRTLGDLYGIWAAQSVGPFKSQQAAREAKNALRRRIQAVEPPQP